jgi:hypothetical protein
MELEHRIQNSSTAFGKTKMKPHLNNCCLVTTHDLCHHIVVAMLTTYHATMLEVRSGDEGQFST